MIQQWDDGKQWFRSAKIDKNGYHHCGNHLQGRCYPRRRYPSHWGSNCCRQKLRENPFLGQEYVVSFRILNDVFCGSCPKKMILIQLILIAAAELAQPPTQRWQQIWLHLNWNCFVWIPVVKCMWKRPTHCWSECCSATRAMWVLRLCWEALTTPDHTFIRFIRTARRINCLTRPWDRAVWPPCLCSRHAGNRTWARKKARSWCAMPSQPVCSTIWVQARISICASSKKAPLNTCVATNMPTKKDNARWVAFVARKSNQLSQLYFVSAELCIQVGHHSRSQHRHSQIRNRRDCYPDCVRQRHANGHSIKRMIVHHISILHNFTIRADFVEGQFTIIKNWNWNKTKKECRAFTYCLIFGLFPSSPAPFTPFSIVDKIASRLARWFCFTFNARCYCNYCCVRVLVCERCDIYSAVGTLTEEEVVKKSEWTNIHHTANNSESDTELHTKK